MVVAQGLVAYHRGVAACERVVAEDVGVGGTQVRGSEGGSGSRDARS